MRASALIRTLTNGHGLGHRASAGQRPGTSKFWCRLDHWLDQHGAALGCLVVLLTFVGAVDLIKHLLTLL